MNRLLAEVQASADEKKTMADREDALLGLMAAADQPQKSAVRPRSYRRAYNRQNVWHCEEQK